MVSKQRYALTVKAMSATGVRGYMDCSILDLKQLIYLKKCAELKLSYRVISIAHGNLVFINAHHHFTTVILVHIFFTLSHYLS